VYPQPGAGSDARDVSGAPTAREHAVRDESHVGTGDDRQHASHDGEGHELLIEPRIEEHGRVDPLSSTAS
jgi:hypothetical protein